MNEIIISSIETIQKQFEKEYSKIKADFINKSKLKAFKIYNHTFELENIKNKQLIMTIGGIDYDRTPIYFYLELEIIIEFKKVKLIPMYNTLPY